MHKTDIQKKINSIIMLWFRPKRMAKFVEKFQPDSTTSIIDVGGDISNWELIDCTSQFTLLNIRKPVDTAPYLKNFSFVTGDGTNLCFPDNCFDIAYSNSVIEHLHNYGKQQRFASEMLRVGKSVWVQTPAKLFFVDPHLFTPFIHYLPSKWQRHLLRNFTIWGWLTRPTQDYVDRFLEEVRFLNYREMKQLFPECYILKEKFLFLTKAYIAIKVTGTKK